MKSTLVWLTAVAVVLLIGSFAAKRYFAQHNSSAVLLSTPSDCALPSGHCRLPLPEGGSVDLSFMNLQAALQPFWIHAQLPVYASATQELKVELTMREMDMGFNQFTLTQNPESLLWQTQAMLPICSAQRNDWLLKLEWPGRYRWEIEFSF